ncbi:MAG: RnfABCDGE type electron transport complex subunit D [Tepidisphaeraceae bacterium]|jgi:Na+-translocating ferredoxin:NAD+ oxidoreductase RnfD subunit
MSIAADNTPDATLSACPSLRPVPTPLHSGIGVGTFILLNTLAALFPLMAGCLLFGWRAVGVTTVVVFTSILAGMIWRHVGRRGAQVKIGHCVWLGILLSLMLPAHLFTTSTIDGQIPWPILPGGAIACITLSWLLSGLGAERVSPPVATILILFVLFHTILTPRYVLWPDRVGRGDLLRVDTSAQPPIFKDPWIMSPPTVAGPDALQREPVADKLIAYTSAQQRPDRASITLEMLIRDEMPPLEDLIIGGQVGTIGNASAVGVIIGGLFLLYRGMLDFRLPLFGVIAAMITLLILPIPVLITDQGPHWHWLAFREHYLGWPTAITFVNYEIMASPLLLTLFFLANSPAIRPITRRGRTVFSLSLGALAAICQLYFSVAIGPYIALLVIGLLTPMLDRTLRPKTLV